MIPAWQAAHFNILEKARSRGELRTVAGHAYPVPDGELQRWLANRRKIELTARSKRSGRRRESFGRVYAEALFT